MNITGMAGQAFWLGWVRSGWRISRGGSRSFQSSWENVSFPVFLGTSQMPACSCVMRSQGSLASTIPTSELWRCVAFKAPCVLKYSCYSLSHSQPCKFELWGQAPCMTQFLGFPSDWCSILHLVIFSLNSSHLLWGLGTCAKGFELERLN